MSEEPRPSRGGADVELPPGTPTVSGKVIVGVIVPLIFVAFGIVGAIGYHHATRNERRHEQGAKSGAELYAMYCQRCHLEDGGGTDMAYPPILKNRPSLEVFTIVVKEGREQMPSFRETLFEDEYEPLYEHAETLPAAHGRGDAPE